MGFFLSFLNYRTTKEQNRLKKNQHQKQKMLLYRFYRKIKTLCG